MMRDIGYKIAICDDDEKYILYLKKLIKSVFDGRLEFFAYHSGEELLNEVDVLHDVVFLDMQMGGIDGTMTARKMREGNKLAVLVYCSGVVAPTPESIKMSPYRYLLKQFSEAHMKQELVEIMDKMVESYREEFVVAENLQGLVRVYINDIIYIEKIKRGSRMFMIDPYKYGNAKEYLAKRHLKEIYIQLEKYGFAYAHDSYLVNCRWVAGFERAYLKLENGVELNIARSKYADFQKTLIQYWDKYEGGKMR